MRPAINSTHQQLIDAFDAYGGYDTATLLIIADGDRYKVRGLVNAAKLVHDRDQWSVSTRHLGFVVGKG